METTTSSSRRYWNVGKHWTVPSIKRICLLPNGTHRSRVKTNSVEEEYIKRQMWIKVQRMRIAKICWPFELWFEGSSTWVWTVSESCKKFTFPCKSTELPEQITTDTLNNQNPNECRTAFSTGVIFWKGQSKKRIFEIIRLRAFVTESRTILIRFCSSLVSTSFLKIWMTW